MCAYYFSTHHSQNIEEKKGGQTRSNSKRESGQQRQGDRAREKNRAFPVESDRSPPCGRAGVRARATTGEQGACRGAKVGERGGPTIPLSETGPTPGCGGYGPVHPRATPPFPNRGAKKLPSRRPRSVTRTDRRAMPKAREGPRHDGCFHRRGISQLTFLTFGASRVSASGGR